MKRKWFFLFFVVFILLSFPENGSASDNLQHLIDSAEEGAVIQLENKTYEGNIEIHKTVEMIGGNQTIIKGDGTGNVISVRAPGVKLRNLTVMNSSMNRNSSEEYAAIKIYSNDNVLDHIQLKDFFHGIYLSQAHNNTIQNSEIKGLGKGEIASQGNGLHVYYANNNTLKNNRIEGTRDGMFFDYANNNTITDNRISDTRYGLHYMYSDENSFKDNIFTFNTGGAAIMHSSRIKLTGNQFIFNYGHRSFGLLLLATNDVEVWGNTFFLNQRGLYIDQATASSIKNNRIIKNQIGIELWASSNHQIFSGNQIHENTIPAVSLGGHGQNSWSDQGIGNDWGKTFSVIDLDENGLGDEPVIYHSSLHELIEDQELTYLFLKSPAIAVYEKMNALLNNNKPIFEDPYPLVPRHDGKNVWIWMLIGIVILAILIKGRNWLCIMFGRNGRKM
ncbi:nitrous oxide reductase family maturation protein NosD [Bacillus sp. FJAT-47783]|uniref:nitrous oxide reductase family maturation protein NosD n=1 Tax=Bacillus sp. FJAT-47783 TaxID=2922712 RepID=UPI001FAE4C7F|nr:nitrous oxide reductase family maturation protein NosD [Bacillus sp. FJAT-47783]